MSATQAINVGWRRLGLDEETARDVYERVTGKRSLRLMTSSEQLTVLAEFKSAPTAQAKGLKGPYAKKLQALWIAGWNLGVVRDRTDAAMLSCIKRQTGVEHTVFLRDAKDARKAVEALKNWIKRDAGVMYGNTNGHDWLASDPAKIAWAQWQQLEPGSTLHPLDMPFYCFVLKTSDVACGSSLANVKPAGWQAVMNALGKRIRAKVPA